MMPCYFVGFWAPRRRLNFGDYLCRWQCTAGTTRNNALKVCELAGQLIRRVFGCARPMVRVLNTAENVHGQSGLDLPGGGVLPEPSMTLRSSMRSTTLLRP
ncbi:MAG: hypothetical protein Ct9H300mP14_14100 [Gammaproteobacteria bacterium]|nr:MAG: hypothetical protein Ct9H300mP14_14100 [Gammaproteobacteria bacterium]